MAKRKPPAGRRSQAKAANSRRRKKRRTGKRTIHYILLILFVLATGTILSLTTFFKIEQVRVVGTDKYVPTEVALASGIEEGENLFRVNTSNVEENLLSQFPYIESVTIRRKLPPAIELQVTQSTPAAAIMEEHGDVVLITRQGKVLERGDLFIPAEIPVVKGLTAVGIRAGGYLDEAQQESLGMLDYLFAAMDATEFSEITNVDLTDRLNMKIIYQNRYLLLLGSEANLEYKLLYLKEIIQKEPPNGEGLIDVGNAALTKRTRIKDISLEEALELVGSGKYVSQEADNPSVEDESDLQDLDDEITPEDTP